MNSAFYMQLEAKLLERSTLTVLIVAISVRLLNLLAIDDLATYSFLEDSPIYWNGAKAWIDSGYFSRLAEDGFLPETERVPLYHLFLIPFRWTFVDALAPVLIAQSLVDCATCVLIAKMAGLLCARLGLISGLLAALWPNLIIHCQLIFGETLFVFLFTAFIYSIIKFLRTGYSPQMVYAGLVCGLAIMTRPIALFVPFLAALAAPIVMWRLRGRWLPGFGAAAALGIATLLVLSPLLWRNATQFGTLQLTSQSGSHFLHWVVGYAVALEQERPFEQVAYEIQNRLIDKLKRRGERVPNDLKLDPFASSRLQMAHVFEELEHVSISTLARAWGAGAVLNLAAPAIVTDPRIRSLNNSSMINTTGSSLADRVFAFLNGNDPRFVVWTLAGIILSGVSSIMQFAGMIVLLRKCFWPTVFGCLVIAYFLLINGPVGAPKYRLPFEPIMIIFQAASLSLVIAWFGKLINRRRSDTALSEKTRP